MKSRLFFGPYETLDFLICSMLLDIYATLFYIPISLFPLPGFCAGGLMKDWGHIWGSLISFDIYMFLIGMCGAAMNCAFVFRYAAVTNKVTWFDKKTIWAVMGLFHVFLALPAIFTHELAFWLQGTEDLILEYIERVS